MIDIGTIKIGTELADDQDVRLVTTLAVKFPRSFRVAECEQTRSGAHVIADDHVCEACGREIN